eukprot:266793_1
MKQLMRKLEKDGQGSIRLIPEHCEDMWHIYNLLTEGDSVTAVTFRKVQKSNNPTGSSVTERVKVKVTILVENIDFDSNNSEIRVSGKNTSENRFIKLGQYHTIELAENRPFTLIKPCWDAMFLERLGNSLDARQSAEVAAIVMQPGLAHLLLVTPYMTIRRARVEVNIPRKRVGSSTRHDKGQIRFFGMILDAIIQHINFEVVKCLIIASPAFLKDDFSQWLYEESRKRDLKSITENRDKIILCHSSSGHTQALTEILQDPQVLLRLEDTKAAREVKLLDSFLHLMNTDPDRAFYGFDHVRKANDASAIETLLVTDDLFRSADIKTRKQYVSLVESVKDNGGEVSVFSVMHPSGEQLNDLTGVAAILRFPFPGIETDSESEDEKR